MAYDHDLADRIRELLPLELDHEEKAMFGGLAFLVGGHMAIAASRETGVLVRVDPADEERLLRSKGVSVAVMRGRPGLGGRARAHTVPMATHLDSWRATRCAPPASCRGGSPSAPCVRGPCLPSRVGPA